MHTATITQNASTGKHHYKLSNSTRSYTSEKGYNTARGARQALSYWCSSYTYTLVAS